MAEDSSPLPEDRHEEEDAQRPSMLKWITIVLIILVAGALYYNYKFNLKAKDPTFSLKSLIKRIPGDPPSLGMKVTVFVISPLTTAADWNRDRIPDGLSTTVYTKIGYKAVRAAGNLDFSIYEYDQRSPNGRGKLLQSWKTIHLPDSREVAWGSWPLGGWKVRLPWQEKPQADSVYLVARYTKPNGQVKVEGQGPISLNP